MRPRPPETLRARVAIVGAAVALAVTAHLLKGGRRTWVLFGFVGIVSLLVSLPRLGWLAKPVGAYVGLWLVFNLFRAGADDTDWADVVLGLVPRLEAWLFGGQLPSGLLQEWFYSAGDFDWFDYGLVAIYLSFFVVPHAIAILLLWRNRQLFWQYALSFLVLFTLSAASFYLMPTSPPGSSAKLFPRMDTFGSFASTNRYSPCSTCRFSSLTRARGTACARARSAWNRTPSPPCPRFTSRRRH